MHKSVFSDKGGSVSYFKWISLVLPFSFHYFNDNHTFSPWNPGIFYSELHRLFQLAGFILSVFHDVQGVLLGLDAAH